MEVLSGGVGAGAAAAAGAGAGAGAGSKGDAVRAPPLPPPPGRRYSRRQSSPLSLSASDMFLFRPPKPTYIASSWPGDLCVLGSTVCLALERVGGASKVLLFCHGTSSDLGMSRRSLEVLRDGLGCHVIGVEYPGYGLTADGEPNEESINAAVRVAFLHLTEVMGWPAERVVVMGRSLGSGPAARLAREFEPGALFLLAPFTGVADIAGSIVGDTLASMLSLNQWDNKKEVAATASPTLVLHGLKDQVVPHTHSLDLYRASAASKKYVGLLLESDHNRISWDVVCDMYARPFMEMVCPGQRNRALGIRQTDVAKLSNFDPSGKAALILACAEAVWASRRHHQEQEHGGSGGGPAQQAPQEPPTTTTTTGLSTTTTTSSTGQAAAMTPAANPSSSISGSTTPIPSSSPLLRGDGNGNEHGSGTAGTAGTVSPSSSPSPVRVRAEKRIHGGGQNSGTGWSFLPWNGGESRGGDSTSGGRGGGGGGEGLGVGTGGWGSGTVRAPAFGGSAIGSISCGSSSSRSNTGKRSSGDDCGKGGNVGGNAGCRGAAKVVSPSDCPRDGVGGDSKGGSAGAAKVVSPSDCPRESAGGDSKSCNAGAAKAGGAVKLGGAAEYAIVRGKRTGSGSCSGSGGDSGGDGDVTAETAAAAAIAAEGKETAAAAEGGWGKLSGLFSGR